MRNPKQLPIGTGVRATTGGTGPATPLDIVQHRQPAHWPLIDDISGTLDTLYYGSMEFGTPSQALPVDIDTGSADLWVEANCPGCSNDQLKNSVSSTYAASTRKCSLAYATGRVSGTLAQDRVAAGTLSVSNQTFCAARKVSSDMDDEPISGLVGLAFGSIAKSGQPTFFENLLTQRKLPFSIFSVHLTRQQETGSEVCFGCFDPTKALGPILWRPLVSRTYWSIAMDGLSVKLPDGPQEVLANMIAAIDTGTSLIYLPKDIAEQFYALIPGSEAATDRFGPGFYTFPCNTTLTVQLMFGSRPFVVDPFDFNLGAVAEDPDNCVGGILALGDGLAPGLAIIGDEFLKSWYSVFDYSGRVGFAQSINNQY